eukprot:3847442-Prymnesium_polylepis.1
MAWPMVRRKAVLERYAARSACLRHEVHDDERSMAYLWPMVRRKAVLERYAALRCLWPPFLPA